MMRLSMLGNGSTYVLTLVICTALTIAFTASVLGSFAIEEAAASVM